MTSPRTNPMCFRCVHFGETPSGIGCTAFPDGIPYDISVFGFDHRKPYKGDRGIRFKAKDD